MKGELIELCTWQTRIGGTGAAVDALRDAPGLVRGGQGLAGVWTADSGMLNRVVHVWRYADAGGRSELLARSSQGPLAPVQGSVVEASSELLAALPFSPALEPRTLGAFHEFRIYSLPTAAMPDLIERWAPLIEWRQSLSPLIGVWRTPAECGASLTRLVHVWAYRDANEWQAVRALARRSGKWPPPRLERPSAMLEQSSFIALPADFSSLR